MTILFIIMTKQKLGNNIIKLFLSVILLLKFENNINIILIK